MFRRRLHFLHPPGRKHTSSGESNAFVKQNVPYAFLRCGKQERWRQKGLGSGGGEGTGRDFAARGQTICRSRRRWTRDTIIIIITLYYNGSYSVELRLPLVIEILYYRFTRSCAR